MKSNHYVRVSRPRRQAEGQKYSELAKKTQELLLSYIAAAPCYCCSLPLSARLPPRCEEKKHTRHRARDKKAVHATIASNMGRRLQVSRGPCIVCDRKAA